MDEILLKKVKKIPTWLLFTPFSLKGYLKMKYLNVFGFKYLFAKKKGFTPPIQFFRDHYFSAEDFNKVKTFIQNHSDELSQKVNELSFESINKDKILFDRFFFFSLWLKKYDNAKK